MKLFLAKEDHIDPSKVHEELMTGEILNLGGSVKLMDLLLKDMISMKKTAVFNDRVLTENLLRQIKEIREA